MKINKYDYMKKIIITLFGLVSGLFLLTGCENEGFYYQDEARVRLEGPYKWTVGTDSLEFSFITSPPGIDEMVMDITLYVMGKSTDHDRTANIIVVNELTTANNDHYTCQSQVTIPAGAYYATFPLTLKRTADLQEQTVKLYLRVEESEDFKVGVREKDHLLVKWNDILSMPKNWSDLVEFFGSFSMVKYRFIINVTGVTEFNTTTMSWSQLMNYKIIVKNALDEYNAGHPDNPLKDENGQFVTF